MKTRFRLLISLLFGLTSLLSFAIPDVARAARTEVKGDGSSAEAGEPQARKYFRPSSESRKEVGADDHYLALHIGGFASADGYQWGQTPHTSNVGKTTIGVSYRISPVGTLADWLVRADFTSYELNEGRPLLFSVLPLITFPDSSSHFPLYFGAGIGPGIFFSQIKEESFLAVSYQLVAGVRLFNLVGETGFFLEGGLKNHVLLLSDGQFNGFFMAVGAIFTF